MQSIHQFGIGQESSPVSFTTGLPDISAAGSTRLVQAANPAQLTETLQDLEEQAFSLGFDRQAIAASIRPWTWSRFRRDLVVATKQHLLRGEP